MLEIRSRLERRPPASGLTPSDDRLELPFERRQKSRQRATLASGEEVAIELERGQVLRGGDWLLASDGRAIEVVAKPEHVVRVEYDDAHDLARAAYHLGNRHVPIQIGAGWLVIAADRVLERMLQGLGARLTPLAAPFEPEPGAYAAHHRHDNESGHGGRIHEFGAKHE